MGNPVNIFLFEKFVPSDKYQEINKRISDHTSCVVLDDKNPRHIGRVWALIAFVLGETFTTRDWKNDFRKNTNMKWTSKQVSDFISAMRRLQHTYKMDMGRDRRTFTNHVYKGHTARKIRKNQEARNRKKQRNQ